MDEKRAHALCYDGPAIYRIRVSGYLAEDWSDRLGGMTISTKENSGEMPVTLLYGKLADQVSLVSVIDEIHTYHRLPLLSIEFVGTTEHSRQERQGED